MNLMKTCCCTGHRPQNFPWDYGKDDIRRAAYLQDLKKNVVYAVENRGITRFISGMALGADLDFAEIVVDLRDSQFPQITLECAIPCNDQTLLWKAADKARYERVLKRADKSEILSDLYSSECMLKRNRFMVDNSDLVIAVYSGKGKGGTHYTVKYALKRKVEVLYVAL